MNNGIYRFYYAECRRCAQPLSVVDVQNSRQSTGSARLLRDFGIVTELQKKILVVTELQTKI
jgi:hypothetical protein